MKRRVTIGALAVAALIAVVVPAVPAQARACRIDHFCTTAWYSDSSYTNHIGGMYEECDGSVYTWGQRTGYVVFRESPC
ncbi:DUF6289 family protein [Longispora albida]|uniref:DUF6289 family protein n=1 Tax=Longispora albida TaxID=203523 RepID=UPI000370BB1D|nr:DUF6289 family protein [Longispora albida]